MLFLLFLVFECKMFTKKYYSNRNGLADNYIPENPALSINPRVYDDMIKNKLGHPQSMPFEKNYSSLYDLLFKTDRPYINKGVILHVKNPGKSSISRALTPYEVTFHRKSFI